MADPVLSARGRLAGLMSRPGATPAAILEAKRELNCANAERAIQKALDVAPPLTAEQRARLAVLIVGGGSK
ncbi:hypothetical protein JOD57_003487 [Geodermatophilus bullaregiensis]|uniref:hypothetical protein n=1 Tax=Geodermatophilus bullaregiensis TaxID=1564160 RepID=UPI00195AE60B|nr:hypothetical protein [Geodermatophilus bullaregiensis]MBM7807650.1 hypothetical protein [Geodermatophilus bullaregiensis]